MPVAVEVLRCIAVTRHGPHGPHTRPPMPIRVAAARAELARSYFGNQSHKTLTVFRFGARLALHSLAFGWPSGFGRHLAIRGIASVHGAISNVDDSSFPAVRHHLCIEAPVRGPTGTERGAIARSIPVEGAGGRQHKGRGPKGSNARRSRHDRHYAAEEHCINGGSGCFAGSRSANGVRNPRPA